jgi:hypothetical protein
MTMALTYEEKLEWGRQENKTRLAELKAVESRPVHERAAVFARVQEGCRARRLRLGLSAGEAFSLVNAAQAEERERATRHPGDRKGVDE